MGCGLGGWGWQGLRLRVSSLCEQVRTSSAEHRARAAAAASALQRETQRADEALALSHRLTAAAAAQPVLATAAATAALRAEDAAALSARRIERARAAMENSFVVPQADSLANGSQSDASG